MDKVVLLLLAGAGGFDPYIWVKLNFPFSQNVQSGCGARLASLTGTGSSFL